NRLVVLIVDDELLYERIEEVHDHQKITSTRVVPSTSHPPAPSLSSSLSLPLRDLSPLSLLLAGAVWWLQPIGGGGQISPLFCFLVPDLFRSPLPCLLMSSTISNDQSDNYGYRGPAWWKPTYTRTQRTIKGKSPRGTCDIAITTRRFRCDKSGSARRTTLGYNGWEHTTITTSRTMIEGSFIKENMVRPKDLKDEDMFGGSSLLSFCSPLLLSHHKSEAKLCREFPEAENPSRRPLTLLRRLSLLLSLSLSVISLLSPSSSPVPCGGCSRLAVVVRSRRSSVFFMVLIGCILEGCLRQSVTTRVTIRVSWTCMVETDLHSDSAHHKGKGGTLSVTPIDEANQASHTQSPRGTCDIAITTRRFRCDKSGSARRTTLGYNGWEHTTITTSRTMIEGSFIKENMVRPKDIKDEDMFGGSRNRLVVLIVDDELLYERIEEVHDHQKITSTRVVPSTSHPPAPSLSSSLSLPLRDLSPLSLLLAGAVWWLQPIGGGGQISPLFCFLVPDLFRSSLPCLFMVLIGCILEGCLRQSVTTRVTIRVSWTCMVETDLHSDSAHHKGKGGTLSVTPIDEGELATHRHYHNGRFRCDKSGSGEKNNTRDIMGWKAYYYTTTKLCREFPEAENPSRRPLSLLRRLSLLLSLSLSVISLLSPSSSPVPCGGCSRLAVVVRSRRPSVFLMSSTISNDQSDNYGYRGPAWWKPTYTRTQRTIKGKANQASHTQSPRGTCDIAITTRRFRCDKSGSARRTTLGYNGWEHTTITTSRTMIEGSFIKENMVRPKDLKDEDMFGGSRNRLVVLIVDDELLYERIEEVHDHQKITSTRVVPSTSHPPAPSLSSSLSLPLRDLSPLSLLLAGAVWWLQPIGGGGQISPLFCFLVPDLFRSPLPCLLMSSTISNDQSDNYGYRGPAWWKPTYTRTQRTIKGKSPRGTCDIAITTRRFRCDKSGSARRTTLGYNGWEHTTITTSRTMIEGSFIKENMVRPKDLKDEDMFGGSRNRLVVLIVDDELLYERIEEVHDHQKITSTRVVPSTSHPPAPSLSSSLSLPLRDLSPLSLLLAGAVWWLQPIGGGGQISPLFYFLVPDLFRSPLPCLLFLDPDPDLG
ncbi:hypothetical protein IGI04_042386, partial [Brassica rapa subsp. trilocularis]